MSKNLIDIFNSVLRKTGRHTVKEVDLNQDNLTEDQRMILEFVNERIEDVAHEWNWNNLSEQHFFETTKGQKQYTLRGKDGKPVDSNRIVYMEIQNPTEEELFELSDQDFRDISDDDLGGEPDYYRVIGEEEGTRDPIIELYPIPGEAGSGEEIIYEYYVRTSDLSTSDVKPPVPWKPVMWAAVMDTLTYDGDNPQQAANMYQRSLTREKELSQSGNKDLVVGGDAGEQPNRSDYGIQRPLGDENG